MTDGDLSTQSSTGNRHSRRLSLASLVVAVSCTILLIVLAPRHSPMAVAFVVGSASGCAALSVLQRKWGGIETKAIVVGISLVFAAAIVTGPRSSDDLWSYTMYGRIVSDHAADPYRQVPADFRNDPFFAQVSPLWRHRASVFGPVWVGYESAATLVAGDSPLANRLAFQLAAAAAAAGALVLVWRRTRSNAALAWLGLNPVIAVAVNGGHNDILVGLAILASAGLVSRRRGASAGVLIGVAALVKLTALFALPGLVLWAMFRRDRRTASRATLLAALTVTLGYLPFIADASRVLAGADRTVTPSSLWNWPADVVLGHDAWRHVAHPLLSTTALTRLSYLSLAVVVVLTFTLGRITARSDAPNLPMGTTTAAYSFGAAYVLPWYSAWALPVVTDDAPSSPAWVIWIQGAVMLAAWKLPLVPSGTILDDVFRGLLTDAAPVLLLLAFILAVTRRPAFANVQPGTSTTG
jgi:Glycosyltransferase family 87